jgi:excisionase family DNA binding protein
MTLIEAAHALGLAPSTLRWQIKNGRLHAKKVGRDWHVTPTELRRYDREVRNGDRSTR